MKMGRHHPGRALRHPAVNHDLRQGHKAELRVLRGDELVGLRNVFALHQLGLHGLQHAHLCERLDGSRAIRRELGVGHGDALKLAAAQNIAFLIHQPRLLAPKHQGANGVGKTAACHAQAFGLQLARRGIVRSQQHLVGCAIPDLRVQIAGGAKGQQRFVPRLLLKGLGELLHGGAKVRCDRHSDFCGSRRPVQATQDQKQ